MIAPEESVPPLDPVILDQLQNLQRISNPRLLRELFSLYRKTLDEKAPLVRDAISRADNQALFQSAHALKSSSANVGAAIFSKLLAEIEMLGRSGQATMAVSHLEQFELEFARVRNAVVEILDRQPK